jgi:hypothetical protein
MSDEQTLTNSPQKMVLCSSCSSALIAWNELPARCVLCESEIILKSPEPHKRDVVVDLVHEMRKIHGNKVVMIFTSIEERIGWEKDLLEKLKAYEGINLSKEVKFSINYLVTQAFKLALEIGIAKVKLPND